ncbi:MAG: DUF2079 domain-containing protein [Candidatus Omnitrophota bacterium]|nr:DUF2079 domain-containing protein [Candidatus Omnitrophota bacterium]MDZ4241562.1 DUF2079 domain-containing protein [Candidatus Omnitrophota bacterium]
MKKPLPARIPTEDKAGKARPFSKRDLLAAGICISVLGLWIVLLTYKFYFFGYYDWDFAMYAQTLHNVANGSLESSVMGISFLANHAEYIVFLLAPLYKLFPHPMLPVYMKVLSLAAGGFIFYRIARKEIGETAALVLLCIYFIYPANIFGMVYEFHYETLNIAFLFLLFWAMKEEKYKIYCLSAFILFLIKENMDLIVIFSGVYSLIMRKTDRLKWGVVPIAAGAAVFFFSVCFFIPSMRTGMELPYQQIELFRSLGDTPKALVANLLFNPVKVMEVLWTPANIRYLKELFHPLLFTSMFSPHILLIVFPTFMQHLLAYVWTTKSIYYHYAITLAPFIFLASVNTLGLLKSRFSKSTFSIILLCIFAVSVTLSLKYSKMYARRFAAENVQKATVNWDLIRQIPSDSGIVTTLRFLAPLISHQHLYPFKNISEGYQGISGRPTSFSFLSNVDYVLMDFEDGWLTDDINEPANQQRVTDFFLHQTPWEVVSAVNEVILFRKTTGGEGIPAVTKLPERPSAVPRGPQVSVDASVVLCSVQKGKSVPSRFRLLPITMIWKSENPVSQKYQISIYIKNNIDGKLTELMQHQIGYAIYPTDMWRKEEFIMENIWVHLPNNLPPGQYSVSLLFRDSKSAPVKRIKVVNRLDKTSDLEENELLKISELTIP